MKCIICKYGEIGRGVATVTLERNGVTVVFRGVPAQVCDNCGEEYVDEATTGRLLSQAEQAVEAGVEVEVRTFAAA